MSRISLLRGLFLIPFLLGFLPGCGPSYPAKDVPESIIKLCKEEYGLDVKVTTIGKTIGISLPIENLVDSSLRLAPEAAEKVEHVSLSIHRVLLSTDRDVEFYVLAARDTKNIGAEFMLAAFFQDVKRARLMDISRDDYHQRIARDFRLNPCLLGEEAITGLFREASAGDNREPSDKQSPETKQSDTLRTALFPTLTIARPGSAKFLITEIDSKEISKTSALIYLKTKEAYSPKPAEPGLETLNATFPSGFENAYLVLVDVAGFPRIIKEVLPQYFLSNGEIKRRLLAKSFEEYKDEKLIDNQGMLVRELELPDFLAEQMARRIKSKFETDKVLSKRFSFSSANGKFEGESFKVILDVRLATGKIEEKERIPEIKTPQQEALEVIAHVIHGYNFEDFQKVEIFTASGESMLTVRKEDLREIK